MFKVDGEWVAPVDSDDHEHSFMYSTGPNDDGDAGLYCSAWDDNAHWEIGYDRPTALFEGHIGEELIRYGREGSFEQAKEAAERALAEEIAKESF